MNESIYEMILSECPIRDTLHWFNSTDSTNTQAKLLAAQDAPQGTVVMAEHQTGGRGRLGRSFSSPAGTGLYLSVILRPGCKGQDIMHLTCAAAVAVCDAIQSATGLRPGIKWTNDLVWDNKKLGGILTELSVDAKTGLVDYAIIGVGINCSQEAAEDFPEELRDMATSLSMVCKKAVSRGAVAVSLIRTLTALCDTFISEKAQLMARYQANCITVGKQIVLLRGDERLYGTALSVEDNGALLVEFDDGSRQSVTSGEVSVRGMYGYV